MHTNYIIIGDSITYGIGDFESGGWATMFKNYIVNKDDSNSSKIGLISFSYFTALSTVCICLFKVKVSKAFCSCNTFIALSLGFIICS